MTHRTTLLALVFFALVVGCENESHSLRTYTIRLTRPDGTVHHTYTIQSDGEPRIVGYEDEGGCLRVMYRQGFQCGWTQPFPVGWLVEVEPLPESNQ